MIGGISSLRKIRFAFFPLYLLFFHITFSSTISDLSATVSVNLEENLIYGSVMLKYKADVGNKSFCFQLDHAINYSIFVNKRTLSSSIQEGNNICLPEITYRSKTHNILIEYTLELPFPNTSKTTYLSTSSFYWIPKFKEHGTINHLETVFYTKKDLNVRGSGIQVLKEPMDTDSYKVKWNFENFDISYNDIYFLIGSFNSLSYISNNQVKIILIYDKKIPKILKLSDPIFNFLEKNLGSFPYKTYFQSTIPIECLEDTCDNVLLIPDNFLDITKNPEDSYVGFHAYKTSLKWLSPLPDDLKQSFATYYKWHALRYFYGVEFQNLYLNKLKHTIFNNPTTRNAFILSAIEREIGEELFQKIIYNLLSEVFPHSITSFKLHLLDKTKDSLYYFDDWIKNRSPFPIDKAFEKITDTESVTIYNTISKLYDKSLELKYDFFKDVITSTQNYLTKIEIVKQLGKNLIDKDLEIIKLGIESNDFYLNNFILDYYGEIPKGIKEWTDTLFLKKPEYLNETRLINFCSYFLENCNNYISTYLNHSSSKFKKDYANLAQLTSTILSTDDPTIRSETLEEINSYINHKNIDVRKETLKLLEQKAILLDSALKLLIAGMTHENKDYANFCKKLMDKLQKIPYYKARLDKIDTSSL